MENGKIIRQLEAENTELKNKVAAFEEYLKEQKMKEVTQYGYDALLRAEIEMRKVFGR